MSRLRFPVPTLRQRPSTIHLTTSHPSRPRGLVTTALIPIGTSPRPVLVLQERNTFFLPVTSAEVHRGSDKRAKKLSARMCQLAAGNSALG